MNFLIQYKYPILFAGYYCAFQGGMQFYKYMNEDPNPKTLFLYGFMFSVGVFIIGFYAILSRQGKR
ncbi:MAG: hypothetical protein OEZ13_00645 [Spirochaetia bacterium]|nr:hypothetical protein [Spirochaetia bacterium]